MSKTKKNPREEIKRITIEFDGVPLHFSVNLKRFHDYQDSILPNNKVRAADNFLTRCIDKQDQESLVEIVDKGYALELAGELAMAFRPSVSIAVKVSSEESPT